MDLEVEQWNHVVTRAGGGKETTESKAEKLHVTGISLATPAHGSPI